MILFPQRSHFLQGLIYFHCPVISGIVLLPEATKLMSFLIAFALFFFIPTVLLDLYFYL